MFVLSSLYQQKLMPTLDVFSIYRKTEKKNIFIYVSLMNECEKGYMNVPVIALWHI